MFALILVAKRRHLFRFDRTQLGELFVKLGIARGKFTRLWTSVVVSYDESNWIWIESWLGDSDFFFWPQ